MYIGTYAYPCGADKWSGNLSACDPAGPCGTMLPLKWVLPEEGVPPVDGVGDGPVIDGAVHP